MTFFLVFLGSLFSTLIFNPSAIQPLMHLTAHQPQLQVLYGMQDDNVNLSIDPQLPAFIVTDSCEFETNTLNGLAQPLVITGWIFFSQICLSVGKE